MKDSRSDRRSCVAAIAGLGAVLGLAYAGHAGEVSITTIVKQGETIAGYGEVGTTPIDVNVNNDGYWITTLPTVNPTGRIILTPDGVFMSEGDVVSGGYVINSLANIYKGMNNHGDIVHRAGFEGPSGFSGLVWNHDAIIVRDQVSNAPEFTPGTPYIGFFRAHIDDNGRALVMATVNDENLEGTVHRALVWLNYDPGTGDLQESVLVKRYDHLPGQPEGVLLNELGTATERFAINHVGDAIYTASFTGGDTATNAAIYVNHTLVAQKGDFGPFEDVTYNPGTSSATRVDINDNGDYLILMPLAGGPTSQNQAILRNNIHNPTTDEVFIRKGDQVPGLDGPIIDSFGGGQQVYLTENGDIVWYASWTGDAGTERGIFVNKELVVRTGSLTSDGDVITNFGTVNAANGIGDTFHISDNGRYIISRVVLNGSTSERAVVLIDLGDTQPSCAGPADLNCDGSIDTADLAALLGAWGSCSPADDCPADLNDDGEVDLNDMLLLLSASE